MDCARLEAIFAGERGDDLGQAESKAFTEHLDSCQPCRERLAAVEDDMGALLSWEPPTPSDAAWAQVEQGWKRELEQTPILTVPPQGGTLSLPIAIALAACHFWQRAHGERTNARAGEDPRWSGRRISPRHADE